LLAAGSREKLPLMTKLIKDNNLDKFLVFVNKKTTAEWLKNTLRSENISTAVMSGDLSQAQRNTNLNNFKSGRVNVLIATDVASRGLDIQDVTYVINYDFPINIKTYIHRIGRTGRAGKQGISVAYLDG
jgi:superfamily II DNA/RNA helicase